MWISVKDELPEVIFFHERSPNFLFSKNVIVRLKNHPGWHKAYLCFTKDYPEAVEYWRVPGFSGDWKVTHWQKVINFKEGLKNA
jgi:phosphoribulokinase